MTSARAGRLPAGWTIARVRAVSGALDAVVLTDDRAVTWVCGPGEDEPPRPELVIGCGCLAVVKALGDDDWYMGSIAEDGSVVCWSVHATPHQALRAL
jgi:hypothetical protein